MSKLSLKIINKFSSAWGKLGTFATIATGILIITGANCLALVYVPTKFLAIPVASAGTLVGTFVCAVAFLKLKGQVKNEEIEEALVNKRKIEDLEKACSEKDNKIKSLEQNLNNQNGMGAFVKYTPSLKLTFLEVDYDITRYFEKEINRVEGKKGVCKLSDTNPEQHDFCAVYNKKGKMEYEIDLEKINAVIEDGKLIICGPLKVEPKTVQKQGSLGSESFLLRVVKKQEWDFDKSKPNFRGKHEKEVYKTLEKEISRDKQEELEKEIKDEVSGDLVNVGNDQGAQFTALGKEYLKCIACGMNLQIEFDEKRTEAQTLLGIFEQNRKLAESSTVQDHPVTHL